MHTVAWDETRLVERARKGDAAAFGEIYRQYREPIYRYIYFRVDNDRDAEDLTSHVFLKAWEALPTYEQRGYRFSSWLYRIAHNATVSYLRRRRTMPLSMIQNELYVDGKQTIVEKLIEAEELSALESALSQLPEEQQRVIQLRFQEDLRHDEVARIINKSPGASRMIQSRALTMLGQLLRHEVARTVGIVLAVWLLVGTATVYASGRAMPGDLLYPVKRSVESTRLQVAWNELDVAQVHLQYAQRRLDEATAAQQRSQPTAVASLIDEYRVEITAALRVLDEARTLTPGERRRLAERMLSAANAHEDRFARLLAQSPDAVRPGVDDALALVELARSRAQAILDEAVPPVEDLPLLPIPTPTPIPPTRTPPPQADVIPQIAPVIATPSTAEDLGPSAQATATAVKGEILEKLRDALSDVEGELATATVEIPAVATALPEIPTVVSEVATALPEIATAIPAIATALPEIPTALPNVEIPPLPTAFPAPPEDLPPDDALPPWIPNLP